MEKKETLPVRLIRTVFARVFVSYIVIIALVFLLVFLLSQGTVKRFYMQNLKKHLDQVGNSMAPKISELFDAGDSGAIDTLVKKLAKKIDIRITVIQPDGLVVADSENDPLEMENHGDRPEIIHALRGDKGNATRFSSTMGEAMLYYAIPVENRGETTLIIRTSVFLKEISVLISDLKWDISGVLIILFAFAVLMAWYFSNGISKPVKDIVAATRKFAEGNFDVKIFLKKKDELGEVADSFNNMVIQQKTLFKKLSDNKAELQAIISSMKEGLMVINRDGKILLCNSSFEEIAETDKIKNKSYWEVLRIPEFEEYVKKAFESGEGFYQEVPRNSSVYLVGFNPMPQRDKLVIIFRDITEFKRLEGMKKDFVVNLTHELKTPLTAIKGFVETLEEEENIENIQYIEIIKRHTDRMNQIVSDLLVLSELEEGKRDIHFESLDLEKMVNNILKIYKEKIKEKGLALDVNIADNLPDFYGERFKMEQLFINLVDNAVKYTEKGKIGISIDTVDSEGDGSLRIQVNNTGAPIPRKSIPRLFERFYVVDKSRSRKLGGTGLGLSIVKHVALLHKGEISVDSTKRDGTTFTVRLPIC
jgi:two-component system, OmpR family, phosphate regulon sensor histidine kinase PhoR